MNLLFLGTRLIESLYFDNDNGSAVTAWLLILSVHDH